MAFFLLTIVSFQNHVLLSPSISATAAAQQAATGLRQISVATLASSATVERRPAASCREPGRAGDIWADRQSSKRVQPVLPCDQGMGGGRGPRRLLRGGFFPRLGWGGRQEGETGGAKYSGVVSEEQRDRAYPHPARAVGAALSTTATMHRAVRSAASTLATDWSLQEAAEALIFMRRWSKREKNKA